jgi:MFS transporter, CP family, cyanate transporter
VEDNNRYRFVIQTLVILVRSCIGIIWASAGPLLPLIMGAYGISRGSAGWFASAAPLTIAAVSLPFAVISARFSLKKTFAVGALLQAGGILTPFATNYPLLIVTRILFAVGTAIVVPVATAISTEWFSSRKLPALNSVMMSFINLGNAIAYFLTVPLAVLVSWKAPITIYGAFALTCALAWIVLGKDRPRRVKVTPVSGVTTEVEPEHTLSFKQVLTRRSTLLLGLATLGCWCLGNSVGSWLPSYYNEVFDMPLQKASSIMSIITAGGTVACLAGGFLTVRIGKRKPFLVLSGIFFGLSALCAILINNSVSIYISVALFGVFGNLHNPSLFTIPMELPDTPLRSGIAIFSVMQCGGNLGNFVGPLMVGYISDATGSYLPGFVLAVVASYSLLVAGLLLPETGPQARSPSARAARRA